MGEENLIFEVSKSHFDAFVFKVDELLAQLTFRGDILLRMASVKVAVRVRPLNKR